MKLNVANPATGAQKLFDIEDERKVWVSTNIPVQEWWKLVGWIAGKPSLEWYGADVRFQLVESSTRRGWVTRSQPTL